VSAPLSTMAVPVSYTCSRVSQLFMSSGLEAYQGIFVERRNRRIGNLLRVSYAQGFNVHVWLAYDGNAVVVDVSLLVEGLFNLGVLYRGSGWALAAASTREVVGGELTAHHPGAGWSC